MKTFKVGMIVKDSDGNIGTIRECDDEHNILVSNDDKTFIGLFCINPKCKKHYDELTIIK